MNANERAAEISSFLAGHKLIKLLTNQPPKATEIPLIRGNPPFAVILNFAVSRELLSLSHIWELTIPVMDLLFKTKKLREFSRIAVQICVTEGKVYERVVRVEATIECVQNMIAKSKTDLLNESLWDGQRTVCHWYWSRNAIPD